MMSVLETKKKYCQKGGELCDSPGDGKLSRQLTSVMSALTIMFHSWSDTCSSQDEKDLRVVSLIVPFELMLGKYSNQSQTEI